MTDNNNPVDNSNKFVASVGATQAAQQNQGTKKSNQVGEQEFLTLLVHQLQNQDPLNPMNSEEFAVQLAQFSQLEQLIQINNKLSGDLGGDGGTSVGAMASFLGHEVVLGDQGVKVSGGRSSNLLVNAPAGVQSARVDFLDARGAIVGSYDVPALEKGRQIIRPEGLALADGAYEVRAVAVDSSGRFVELDHKITGTVDGFTLEPEAALIVGGEQILLSDVKEVYTGKDAA